MAGRGGMRALLGVALLASAASCDGAGDDPVQVGDIGYDATQLLGLGQEQRERLAVLTGFGAAVAEGRIEELVQPRVERELNAMLLQRLELERTIDAAGLTEAQLRAAYLARPEEELVVRHLIVMSERWRPREHRDSAWSRASEAMRRIHRGASFEEVAAEYSDEPGAAERGGLLEPGTRDSWVPEFWAAAERLEEGEVSPVVETRFGYHVLRLESRDTVPFEAVRDEVLPRLIDPSGATEAVTAAVPGGGVELDTAVVDALFEDLAAPSDRPRADVVLARWQGGKLRVAELRRQLAASGAAERARLLAGDRQAFRERVRTLARRAARVQEALTMGLETSPEERRAAELNWREQAERLAAVLGFTEGMSEDEIRRSALEALGATGQAAALARTDVLEMEGLVRLLYPISVAEPAASVNAASGTSARIG